MTQNNENQAWEEEFDKFVDKNYEEKFGLSSTNKLNWGCEECGGEDAESDIKNFIRTLRQKDKERLMEGLDKIEPPVCSPEDITAYYSEAIDQIKNLLNQIYE